jgi:acetyltransferase-like isoleucine patch superfamily enzyme
LIKTRKTLLESLEDEQQSTFRKYQDIYVGRRGLWSLLRYEVAVVLLAGIAGAIGFQLRKMFTRRLFRAAGSSVLIGANVTLRCPGRVSLGENVYIEDNVVLDAKGTLSAISLGDGVLIGRNSVLSCSEASINMGCDVSVGQNCVIRSALGSIDIGSCITVGSNTVIISGAPSYERLDVPMKHQIGDSSGIVIGDDVWIGVGVRIIDGVRIGSGSVIGAGAVVTQDIPALAIAAGVPARIVDMREIIDNEKSPVTAAKTAD